MIEITTGVVFLMSAMYGSGQADNHIDKIHATITEGKESITMDVRSFTDPKQVESYIREEFAETPILVEIARCESTFRQYNEKGVPIRGIANKKDVGVMQINELYHAQTAEKLGYDIQSIQGNVAFAKYLYEKYGSQPWSASAPCWSKVSSDIAKK